MNIPKWLMKQYWRIGEMRAILSLATGMFVLGRWYYSYIPILEPLGLIGALALGTVLTLAFMGVGWVYDKKAKLWTQDIQAKVERNPYRYVPSFADFASILPVIYSLTSILRKTLKQLELPTESLDDFIKYMSVYFSLQPVKDDISRAKSISDEFWQKHSFDHNQQRKDYQTGLLERLKLGFQVSVLRINWIQSITGIFQEILVFGALFSLVIFSDVAVNGSLPTDYLLIGLLFTVPPLTLIIIALGWFYDKKLKIWSVDAAVKVERNPYSYVLEPRLIAFFLPVFMAYLEVIMRIGEELDTGSGGIERFFEYLSAYLRLSPARKDDLEHAKQLRTSLDWVFTSYQKEAIQNEN
jgi:hypothetical protein